MPTKSQTAPSTPRLSEVAQSFVYPANIVKTVWPRVEAKGEELGIRFDWWQRQLGMVVLGYDSAGRYAATVGGIGMSIPRQVGKTYFVAALLVIMCILFPGLQVIWTAHHLRTSTKTFGTLRGLCRRKKVAPHIAVDGRGKPHIRTSNGEQEIRFRNGSAILIGARGEGFGRGFDEVDIEVFDEAQILDTKSLEDMVAAAAQARHEFGALLFFMGTPPRPVDAGKSEEFTLRRKKARTGKATNAVWLEIGADPESDPDDRSQWPVMNPSFPKRTPRESLLRLRENLNNEASWNREGRGIWDDDEARTRLITSDEWSATGITEPPTEGVRSFGVAFSGSGERVGVAGALKHEDGVHVELVGSHTGTLETGISSLADWLAERKDTAAQIVISGRAGASTLEQALLDRGVSKKVLILPTTGQYLGACSMFYDAVRETTVTHLATEGQQVLDDSVAISDKKARGADGAWGWHPTSPDGDETPLEAVSLAHWAARTSKRKPGRKTRVRALP